MRTKGGMVASLHNAFQALDRTAPRLPILLTTPARMTHGYVPARHRLPLAAAFSAEPSPPTTSSRKSPTANGLPTQDTSGTCGDHRDS